MVPKLYLDLAKELHRSSCNIKVKAGGYNEKGVLYCSDTFKLG